MLWIFLAAFFIFMPWPIYFKVSLAYFQIYGFKYYFKRRAEEAQASAETNKKKYPKWAVKGVKIRSLKVKLGNQTGDFDTDLFFNIVIQAVFPILLAYLKAHKIKIDISVRRIPWEQFRFEGIITFCLARLIRERLRR